MEKNPFPVQTGKLEDVVTLDSGYRNVYFSLQNLGGGVPSPDFDTNLFINGKRVLTWQSGWYAGSPLVSFSSSAGAKMFTYEGMKIYACVDGCRAGAKWTDASGQVQRRPGNSNFGDEWLYIDEVKKKTKISMHGFRGGKGKLRVSWDCEANSMNGFGIY